MAGIFWMLAEMAVTTGMLASAKRTPNPCVRALASSMRSAFSGEFLVVEFWFYGTFGEYTKL
jgi:hypothetical protein